MKMFSPPICDIQRSYLRHQILKIPTLHRHGGIFKEPSGWTSPLTLRTSSNFPIKDKLTHTCQLEFSNINHPIQKVGKGGLMAKEESRLSKLCSSDQKSKHQKYQSRRCNLNVAVLPGSSQKKLSGKRPYVSGSLDEIEIWLQSHDGQLLNTNAQSSHTTNKFANIQELPSFKFNEAIDSSLSDLRVKAQIETKLQFLTKSLVKNSPPSLGKSRLSSDSGETVWLGISLPKSQKSFSHAAVSQSKMVLPEITVPASSTQTLNSTMLEREAALSSALTNVREGKEKTNSITNFDSSLLTGKQIEKWNEELDVFWKTMGDLTFSEKSLAQVVASTESFADTDNPMFNEQASPPELPSSSTFRACREPSMLSIARETNRRKHMIPPQSLLWSSLAAKKRITTTRRSQIGSCVHTLDPEINKKSALESELIGSFDHKPSAHFRKRSHQCTHFRNFSSEACAVLLRRLEYKPSWLRISSCFGLRAYTPGKSFTFPSGTNGFAAADNMNKGVCSLQIDFNVSNALNLNNAIPSQKLAVTNETFKRDTDEKKNNTTHNTKVEFPHTNSRKQKSFEAINEYLKSTCDRKNLFEGDLQTVYANLLKKARHQSHSSQPSTNSDYLKKSDLNSTTDWVFPTSCMQARVLPFSRKVAHHDCKKIARKFSTSRVIKSVNTQSKNVINENRRLTPDELAEICWLWDPQGELIPPTMQHRLEDATVKERILSATQKISNLKKKKFHKLSLIHLRKEYKNFDSMLTAICDMSEEHIAESKHHSLKRPEPIPPFEGARNDLCSSQTTDSFFFDSMRTQIDMIRRGRVVSLDVQVPTEGNLKAKKTFLPKKGHGDATTSHNHKTSGSIASSTSMNLPAAAAQYRSPAFANKDEEVLIASGFLLDRNNITVASLANHLCMDIEQISELASILLEGEVDERTRVMPDEAELIAIELNLLPELRMTERGNTTKLVPRQAVIAVIGHVDHGKTTLLDYLRRSFVAADEARGITQSVAAFEVCTPETRSLLTFIDTPGHKAFYSMRDRGIKIADISILVIAADEGIKPLTLQAYETARTTRSHIVVAVTKIDKSNGNISGVKADIRQQLRFESGEGQIVPISAVTGEGIRELEETLAEVSRKLELKASIDASKPKAFILEAGNSIQCNGKMLYSCILQEGLLKIGAPGFLGRRSCCIHRLYKSAYGKLIPLTESPKPGQPFEMVLREEIYSEKLANSIHSNGVGEFFIQCGDRKEWRRLQRFYSGLEADPQNKTIEKNPPKKEIPANTLQILTNKKSPSISTALSYEQFLVKSRFPQIQICISAPNRGKVDALKLTIDEINNEQSQLYKDVHFPFLTKEEKSLGKNTWKRKDNFQSLPIPLPFRILRTLTEIPQKSLLDSLRECSCHLFLFGFDEVSKIKEILRDPILKVRTSDVIYRLTDDLRILLQYHVGPRLLRTECAKGTAVTQVANVTFNGKKCRVSEIKLISGKIQQAETVLDIWRTSTKGQLNETANLLKDKSCHAQGISIESLAVNGQRTQSVTAPQLCTLVTEFKDIVINDVFRYFDIQEVPPPFNDSRFETRDEGLQGSSKLKFKNNF